jgi:hypothetical protein
VNNKERLEHLLTLTIEDLIAKIDSGEATSADLSVATKLLKDNVIDVNVSSEDANAMKLSNITAMPFKAPKKA